MSFFLNIYSDTNTILAENNNNISEATIVPDTTMPPFYMARNTQKPNKMTTNSPQQRDENVAKEKQRKTSFVAKLFAELNRYPPKLSSSQVITEEESIYDKTRTVESANNIRISTKTNDNNTNILPFPLRGVPQKSSRISTESATNIPARSSVVTLPALKPDTFPSTPRSTKLKPIKKTSKTKKKKSSKTAKDSLTSYQSLPMKIQNNTKDVDSEENIHTNKPCKTSKESLFSHQNIPVKVRKETLAEVPKPTNTDANTKDISTKIFISEKNVTDQTEKLEDDENKDEKTVGNPVETEISDREIPSAKAPHVSGRTRSNTSVSRFLNNPPRSAIQKRERSGTTITDARNNKNNSSKSTKNSLKETTTKNTPKRMLAFNKVSSSANKPSKDQQLSVLVVSPNRKKSTTLEISVENSSANDDNLSVFSRYSSTNTKHGSKQNSIRKISRTHPR